MLQHSYNTQARRNVRIIRGKNGGHAQGDTRGEEKLAEACENRTHPGRLSPPHTGFEAQAPHQKRPASVFGHGRHHEARRNGTSPARILILACLPQTVKWNPKFTLTDRGLATYLVPGPQERSSRPALRRLTLLSADCRPTWCRPHTRHDVDRR